MIPFITQAARQHARGHNRRLALPGSASRNWPNRAKTGGWETEQNGNGPCSFPLGQEQGAIHRDQRSATSPRHRKSRSTTEWGRLDMASRIKASTSLALFRRQADAVPGIVVPVRPIGVARGPEQIADGRLSQVARFVY